MEDRRFDVFVSYNSADQAVVHGIAERLRSAHIEPWLDKWVLTPGLPWQEEIVEGLARASTCAVMVGPAGLGDWAREELAVAQDRAAKDRDFRMFMVLLPGAPDIGDPSLAFLRTRTWVDLRAGTADPRAFQDLVHAILGTAPTATVAGHDGADVVCPYRGLESFDAEHAEYFFGREEDTARILELLRAGRFVGVLGPSGSGKSSLVRAGVVHALQVGRLPGSEAWTTRVFRPGAHPLTVLAAQLARVFPEKSMQRTLDEMTTDERSLDLAVTLALAEQPADRRLVLVADQFEEAFTLCADEEERKAFLGNLLYAATIPGGRVVVIIAMRADFYHLCARYRELRTLVASSQFLVGPLTAEGLRRAIAEPARRVGVELEAGLLETILTDIGDRPGTLPLLQHVLFEVWQRRRGHMLTLEAYVASGRLEGALAKRANAVYAAMPPHQQEVARRVLLRLVQPGEGTEDTRRRAGLDELVLHQEDRETVATVIEALAGERLVTSDHDEVSGARVVDITHEALIRGWPELRTWIAEHRDVLRAERRLTEATVEWDRSGRDDGLLYRGARLAEWDGRDLADLNDLEREFLAASRDRQQRERSAGRRRARIAVGGILVAVTAVATVSLIGLTQVAEQRDLAGSRLAVANSAAQLDREPLRALLLALEAYRLRPSGEAEQAVRLATQRSAIRAQLPLVSPTPPAFSPDGRTVVTGGSDGKVRLWDWEGRDAPRLLEGHAPGDVFARFSPDGRRVVSGGADGTMRLWDAATGAAQLTVPAHEGGLVGAVFSPNGRMVASVGRTDATVRVWDAASGAAMHTLGGHEGGATSAEFSPDSSLVVSAGYDPRVRIWSLVGEPGPVVLRGHAGAVGGVTFSPDGTRVASAGGSDGTVRVWDRATGEATVLEYYDGPVNGVVFSPDGRHVAGVGFGGAIRVWEWGVSVRPRELLGHEILGRGLAFSPDGALIVSASYDNTVRVWAWGDESGGVVLQQAGALFGTSWSRDGRLVVSAGSDGVVRVVDWARRTEVKTLRGHAGGVLRADFSPDGTKVVSSGFDGTARVWDIDGTREPVVLRGHQALVSIAAFSADGGTVLTSGADATVRLWDWAASREIRRLNVSFPMASVVFGPDGSIVGGGVDGVLRVLDATTGAERQAFRGHTGTIVATALSPDARLIASAGFDGTVRIWERATGAAVHVLRGHHGSISSASFSADGRLVATSGVDGTVRVWDVVAGRGLLALRGHDDPVSQVSFGPRDLLMVSTGYDGSVRLWSCGTCGPRDEVLAMARQRAVRELTDGERAAFLPEGRSSGLGLLPILVLGILAAAAVAILLVRRSSRREAALRGGAPTAGRP